MKKAILKTDKKVLIARLASLVLSIEMLLSLNSCAPNVTPYNYRGASEKVAASEQVDETTNKEVVDMVEDKQEPIRDADIEYRSLEELQKVKIPTKRMKYGGKVYYEFANEEDLLQLSREYKYAIEDYFKAHGASDLSNPDEGRFWPEDIEYIVVAIAFYESSYATDCINELNYGGLTGLHKEDILKTLDGWANNKQIWGENIPYINCNPKEVDIFNASTCIEYTYYNFAYMLANRLKKDKVFWYEGKNQSIWKHNKYSDEVQQKLIIAYNMWGIGNLTRAGLGIHEEGHTVKYYANSKYVARVEAKKEELINKYGYEDNLELSQ